MWPHIYLSFYLFILGYCGNAIKPAICHHCLVKVNISSEIGDVQINCGLSKLVTHGLCVLLRLNWIKISRFVFFSLVRCWTFTPPRQETCSLKATRRPSECPLSIHKPSSIKNQIGCLIVRITVSLLPGLLKKKKNNKRWLLDQSRNGVMWSLSDGIKSWSCAEFESCGAALLTGPSRRLNLLLFHCFWSSAWALLPGRSLLHS